jgi:hypothetical protein
LQNKSNKQLDIEQIMKTSSLIDYDGINIHKHEHMENILYNINNHQYLFIDCQSRIINWYNNPTLYIFVHVS